MFDDYDKILSAKMSVDYWSDEAILLAEEKLACFTEDDWLTLTKTVLTKPSFWQVRCAESLGDFEDLNSVNLLMSLVEIDSVYLREATLDSINSLLSHGMDIGMYRERLLRLVSMETDSSLINVMLQSLRKKLL